MFTASNMKVLDVYLFVVVVQICEVKGFPYKEELCGSKVYNTAYQTCCVDVINSPAEWPCCGKVAYNPQLTVCCQDVVQGKKDASCCKTTAYYPTLEICCNDQLYPIRGGQCCGNKQFSSSTHTCCEGVLSVNYGQNYSCCNQNAYHPLLQTCCSGKLYSPGGQQCCDMKPYNPVLETCCNGTVDKPGGRSCCGTQSFDPSNQACCNGVLLPPGKICLPKKGEKAFSQPESLALKQLMDSMGRNTIAYLTLHSFVQMWAWPWGYTLSVPSDLNDLMQVYTFILLLMIGSCYGSPTRKRRFDGNQVLRILPKSFAEIEKILSIGKKYRVDVWKVPKSLNNTIDIHVDANNVQEFVMELESIGSKFDTWIDDVQKLVDSEIVHTPHVHTRAASSFNLAEYHSSSSISAFLDAVAAASSHAEVHTAGHSVAGQSIKYIKISTGGTKKAILIDGGIHAREWIAPAVVLYLIDQLALNPHNDATITSMIQKYDWYLLPLLNPDGYDYTISNNRMWRKNRAQSKLHNGCRGVDLNRNFGFHWSPDIGGSTDECEENYVGEKAFSEPEALALKQLMDSIGRDTIAYLNVHSYGQMWLWPWGYTLNAPSDVNDLKHMATAGASAIYSSHHAAYTVGSDSADLYPAAGGADDYAKGGAGIKYSYTLELRDKGQYGFILPSSYIMPSGEETLKGILAFANELAAYEHL